MTNEALDTEATPVQRFHAQIYRINDVVGWSERKELVLSPSFQRRQVWSRQGKSNLIDSIVRGMPIPQLFVREIVHPRERRTVREVVDGQQRIAAILDYIDGKFTVLPSHNAELAGRHYSDLPESIQRAILSFPLSVNILTTTDDAEVLEIFSRINSYSVTLNRQELLNAKYTGAFKSAMHEIARRHLAYWRDNDLLTNAQFARMGDVDLTSDLIVTMLGGLHDGKNRIEVYFKKYDDAFPLRDTVASQFELDLTVASKCVGLDIKDTEFHRVPLFYSLITAIHETVFGFGCESPKAQRKLIPERLAQLNGSIQELSDFTAKRDTNGQYREFVSATLRSTDKLPQRQLRHNTIRTMLKPAFEPES